MPDTSEMEYVPVGREVKGQRSRGLRSFMERLLLSASSAIRAYVHVVENTDGMRHKKR